MDTALVPQDQELADLTGCRAAEKKAGREVSAVTGQAIQARAALRGSRDCLGWRLGPRRSGTSNCWKGSAWRDISFDSDDFAARPFMRREFADAARRSCLVSYTELRRGQSRAKAKFLQPYDSSNVKIVSINAVKSGSGLSNNSSTFPQTAVRVQPKPTRL
jgi:hypothetical protein